MKRHERLAAAVLIVVGVAIALHSWQVLKLGTARLPDSGFLPFLAAVLLTVTSGLWFVRSLGRDEQPRPFWQGRVWLRPLLATLLMFAYAWAMTSLGYVVATLLFMLAWQFGLEREHWLRGSFVSLLSTAAMWLLFTRLLGVPVPRGPFA